MPEIVVSGLAKSFGAERALAGIDFRVHDKEFLTLLGPSGCGKTTTLMSIAGFQSPDAGRIDCGTQTFVDTTAKVELPAEQRHLGMVFQSYAIWPHMTVAENVAFPLKVRKADKRERVRRVAETLDLVEMSAYAARYPHELSGGQQQRVALARALVYRPSVLLLDEPFSNLDAKLRERARAWLRQLQSALDLTTVFVTHDQDEAMSLSDRILVMSAGEILQSGTPEDVYRRPDSRFVAEFLGHCNVLPGRVVSSDGAVTRVALVPGGPQLNVASAGPPAGEQVEVVLRPESLVLGGPWAEGAWTATVLTRSFLGDHYAYELDVDGVAVIAQSAESFAPSSTVGVRVPANAPRVLPSSPDRRTPGAVAEALKRAPMADETPSGAT